MLVSHYIDDGDDGDHIACDLGLGGRMTMMMIIILMMAMMAITLLVTQVAG